MISDCVEAHKDTELPLLGVLSGTPLRMGPVGIRIQKAKEAFVDVGFCFQNNGVWQWQHRWLRGEDNRLVPHNNIGDPSSYINEAIPEVTDPVRGSPGKFTGWKKIRTSERVPFSLSTRTPRQPALTVEYKCRWCEKKGSEKMVLVECECCKHIGNLIAYHENCLSDAMSGAEIKLSRRDRCGGEIHILRKLIIELIEQRESASAPVLIPAKYEACYFCGVFRKKGKYFLRVTGLDDIKPSIRRRREDSATDVLGEVTSTIIIDEIETEKIVFDADSTFEEFYDTQPSLQ